MKYILAINVIIALVCMFFVSLFSISENGFGGLIITGLIGFALYKIFSLIREGYKTDDNTDGKK